MRKPTVKILVGPIACGKSTYAQGEASRGAVVVSDDAIAAAIGGGNYAWSKRLKPVYKAAEIAIVQAALLRGLDVVIDRPNYSRSMRRRWIGIAHAFDATPVIVLFVRDTPAEHARRRFQADNRGLTFEQWHKAARRHERLFEPPNEDEGYDAILNLGAL